MRGNKTLQYEIYWWTSKRYCQVQKCLTLIYFSSNKILKTFHSAQPDCNSCLSCCPQLPFVCDPDIVALVFELS